MSYFSDRRTRWTARISDGREFHISASHNAKVLSCQTALSTVELPMTNEPFRCRVGHRGYTFRRRTRIWRDSSDITPLENVPRDTYPGKFSPQNVSLPLSAKVTFPQSRSAVAEQTSATEASVYNWTSSLKQSADGPQTALAH